MVKTLCTATFSLLLMLGTLSHADIYKYVDNRGVTVFTNIPKDNSYKRVITEKSPGQKSDVKRSAYYNRIISGKSNKYEIEPSLIKAVITAESNWQPAVVSKKGAVGLMQLMPSTSKDMNVNNPFNPEENIDGGTKYLRYLIDTFHGDLTLALAAYNAGPETVRKFGGVPPYPETQQYVKRVLSMYGGTPQIRKQATIYKVVNDNGTVLYTNTPSSYKQLKPSKF